MALYPMNTGNPGGRNAPGQRNSQQQQKTVKKKVNPIAGQKYVDYLDIKFLSRFTNDQGKILPRRITGVTSYQQRQIAQAVKYARHLAFMPFVALDVN